MKGMWVARVRAAGTLTAALAALLLLLPGSVAVGGLTTWKAHTTLSRVTVTQSTEHGKGSPRKVEVGFYSESLCPFCRAFTNATLAPILSSELADIVQLNYFPYGNARRSPGTGEVECQHGAEECRLNRVFACVVNMYPKQKQWFPFVHCVENKSPAEMEDSLDECARLPVPPLNVAEIRECAVGSMGRELERELGAKTAKLNPPHRWVPWLTVNGVPLWNDNDNLEQYICAAYQGKRPDLCFRSKTVSKAQKFSRSAFQSAVCMRDD